MTVCVMWDHTASLNTGCRGPVILSRKGDVIMFIVTVEPETVHEIRSSTFERVRWRAPVTAASLVAIILTHAERVLRGRFLTATSKFGIHVWSGWAAVKQAHLSNCE